MGEVFCLKEIEEVLDTPTPHPPRFNILLLLFILVCILISLRNIVFGVCYVLSQQFVVFKGQCLKLVEGGPAYFKKLFKLIDI